MMTSDGIWQGEPTLTVEGDTLVLAHGDRRQILLPEIVGDRIRLGCTLVSAEAVALIATICWDGMDTMNLGEKCEIVREA